MALILAISSTVTSGHVGNSAAVFALQRLGHEVWPVTTIALPHHPGHGAVADAARLVTPPSVLAATLETLSARGLADAIDAVAIGYMAEPGQTEVTAGWVSELKAARPAVRVLVDPILGDGGRLYVPGAVADAARALLLPVADMLTPNLFELGWLAGAPVRTEAEALDAIRQLAVAETVVTSAPAPPGRAANLLVAPEGACIAETDRFDTVPNGTGDLFSALYLGARMAGATPEVALGRATAGTHATLLRTVAAGARELAQVAAPADFAAPEATSVRQIGAAS